MRRSRGSGAARGRWALGRHVLAFALVLLGAIARPAAAEQADYSHFDHQTTGFPLDGQHLNLRCEQCHLRGIFTGLSRQCSTCHIQGNPLSAVFMPSNHIPTPEPCDTCHTTNTFQSTHFAHAAVMPGTCAQCHNNVNATGKGPQHLVTSASCDQCHTTVSFATSFATFPSGHIPTAQACSTCHDPVKFVPAVMNHAGITSGCTACHAADAPATAPLVFTIRYTSPGSAAVTLTPTSQNYHPPTSALPSHFTISFSCEQCHKVPVAPMPATAAAGGFTGGTMNHKGITVGCATCHADASGPFIGVAALVTTGSKGPHIPISGTGCELCHKSTTVPAGFAGTAMVHTGLNGLSTCANCHEDSPSNLNYYGLTSKLVVRPPVAGPAPNAVTPVDALHPVSGDCSQCHSSTTSFTTAVAEPSNHIPIGTTACANCHLGSTAPYLPANTVMNHAGFTTTCSGCHGAGKNFLGTAQSEAGGQPMQPPGTSGTPGAANHIPYGSADCVGCHSASSTSQGGFKLVTTPALSSAGHTVVNALTCQTCHAAGMAWYGVTIVGPPGTVGTSGSANHIALGTGGCSTCHATNIAVGGFKITITPSLSPAGHAAVSGQSCDSCHAVANSSWYGVTAVAPASNHIPTASAVCSNCHASNFVTGGFKITSSPVLSVAGHLSISSLTCATCHENNTADLGYQGVLTQIYLRPGSTAAGLSPVDAAHATGTLATGDCKQCHATTPPFQGSSNGLPSNHIPLPSSGVGATCTTCHSAGYTPSLSTMNHASVATETCTACHGAGKGPFAGSGPGTGGQPVQPPGTLGTSGAGNHIPVGGADCSGCHASTDTENGTGFKLAGTPSLSTTGHTAVNALSCQTCHAAGMAWYGVTIVVPPGTVGTSGSGNHIALGTGGCSTCHATNIAVGGFKITTTPSLAAAGHAAVSGQTCDSCHAAANSTWYGVTAIAPASNHIPTATAVCSNCHASNFVAGGFKITSSPVLSVAAHTAVSSLTCATCHENSTTDLGYQGVLTRIYLRPGTAVAGLSPIDNAHATGLLATNDCAQCHTTTPPFLGNNLPNNHFPLPSSGAGATCTTCHAAGYSPALSKMVHSAVTTVAGGCAACHGSGKGPFAGSGPGTGGQPVQPPGTLGTSGAGNHIPVSSADCSACHATSDTESGTGFKLASTPLLSSTGHTAVNALSCQSCHTSGMAWYGVTIVVPPGTVGTSGAGNHIALSTADCSICHGSTIAVGAFKIGSTPSLGSAGHTAVSSLSCASCHGTGSAWYGVPSLVTQLSTHIPIASASCNASGCHASAAPNVAVGGFHMTGAPGTSPVLSVTGHSAVSSLTCATCHENNATDLGYQGVLTQIYLRPGTAAAGLSPIDNAHATSTLASNDCSQCHTTTPPFQGGSSSLPSNHIPLPSSGAGATCSTCHAAGYSPASSKMVHSAVTTVAGGCTACHGSGKGPFAGTSPGAGGQPVQPPGTLGTSGAGNHIPVSSADCGACHATTDTESGTGFKLSGNPLLSSAGHAAVSSLSCASCHGTGLAWYGVTSLVTALSTHIPIATAVCTACHASNFVTGGFKITGTPALSVANHTVVASLTCNTCHENNAGDLAFQGVGTSIYVRPGAVAAGLSPVDTNHATGNLAAPNDCVSCHTTTPPFTGSTLPGNHMPLPATSTPACSVCHAAGYAVGKSIMVHSSVTGESCTTCHGSGKGPFAGTSQGTGGQPKQPPGTVGTSGSGNHIPVASADCGPSCHASSDAMTGTGFKTNTTPALSASGHTAVVSSLTCQSCHNTGMAWYGVTIKTPPGTPGAPGAANHIAIPSADNCNTCHANTNYVTFAGTAMNHANISTGCASCHATGDAWYGVTNLVTSLSTHIPISTADCSSCHALNFATGGFKITTSPVLSVTSHAVVTGLALTCQGCHNNNATDLAFQGVGASIYVRPGAAAAGLSPADANHATGQLATSDCSGCHTTTPPFTGNTKPSNHIPSSSTCSNCHTGYTPATTTMNHSDSGVGTAGSPTACATCHGYGAGPYYGTAQGQAGGQPLQPPGTKGGAASSSQHLPFGTATCNTCHTSTTVPGGFKGTTVPHTNAPFMTYTRGNGSSNSGTSTPKCVTCHAPSGAKWYGVSFSTATMGSHHGSTTTADCVDCHSPTGGFAAAAAAAAAKGKLQATRGVPVRPAGGPTSPSSGTGPGSLAGTGPFSHLGVAPRSCASCHRPGGGATALPGGHLPTALSCDACHRTMAWEPATYLHVGVGPGHCASCHAGSGQWATPKRAGHFLTQRSCDVCHHSTSSWLPVMYDHLSPRYRPQTGFVRCIDCHTTNTEMVVPGLSKPAIRKAIPGGPIRNP